MSDEKVSAMSVTDLAELGRQHIAELQAEIMTYDERAAIREASREAELRDKSTTHFAIDALQRPERFAGEHEVARAWLRNYEPHVRIFTRLTA